MNPDRYFIGEPPSDRELTGLGRCTLVRGIQEMHRAGAKVVAERDAYLSNLTATQERCTELLLESRRLRRERDEAREMLAEKEAALRDVESVLLAARKVLEERERERQQ